MKSIKFLAALAIPAMFAACSNEELVVNDVPQQSTMKEVVGAELIGTGISMNVYDGVQTRLDGSGWKAGDQLGLGWLITTATPNYEQTWGALKNSTIWANHLFTTNASGTGDGSASTEGNVYKGWHFAYYPYSYMEMVGEKTVNINPKQEKVYSTTEAGDRFDNKFKISARHFLTKDDLEDNKLKNEKSFMVYNVANEFVITLNPEGSFVTAENLNKLAIKKVTLDAGAGNNVFADEAKLKLQYLADVKNAKGNSVYSDATPKEERVYDANKTKEALYTSLFSGSKKVIEATYKNSIATEIDPEVRLVTGLSSQTRVFTLPATASAEITPTVKVDVEGGYFTIETDPDAVEGGYADENNKALKKLAETYSAGSEAWSNVMTQYDKAVGLNFVLYPEIFTPDFSSIDNYPEWVACVGIVNSLGFEDPQEFTITGDIEVTDAAIAMPANCDIVVKGDKDIIVKAAMKNWPAGLDASLVDVVFDANVTLANATNVLAKSITVNNGKKLTLSAGKAAAKNVLVVPVVNNGTISVAKYADLKGVDNESRIEVVYGSFVNITGDAGIVAYVLTGSEKAKQLNQLIETSATASVNTFVINNGKTLNLALTDPAETVVIEGDPYTADHVETYPETPLKNLSTINIEMNGGAAIVGVQGGAQKVGTIKVLKGINTITDVIPAAINIAAKATLDIDASIENDLTKEKYALDMATTTVENSGTLNAETEVHVLSLTNNNGAKVEAAAGCKFHYTTGTNNGTLTGDVQICNCTPDAPEVDEEAEAVMDAWDALKTAAPDITSKGLLATKLQTVDLSETEWASTKLYNALSAWLAENGYGALSDTPSTFNALYLTVFENTTGEKFFE